MVRKKRVRRNRLDKPPVPPWIKKFKRLSPARKRLHEKLRKKHRFSKRDYYGF